MCSALSRRKRIILERIQRKLALRVRERPLPLSSVSRVAAVDVSYSAVARVGVVVCAFPKCEVLEVLTFEVPVPFSYVPTMFFLRESRPVLMAVRKLGKFDLLIVEGHGKAHPRGYGIASHIGLILGVPTLGIAKAPLRGVSPELWRRVGRAYVSVGHLIDLDSAEKIVSLIPKRRGYPLPVVIADELSKGKQYQIENP